MIKVRVQSRVTKSRSGREYRSLFVTIPSSVAEFLSIREGDVLWCDVRTVDINGRQVRAVVYYKAEQEAGTSSEKAVGHVGRA